MFEEQCDPQKYFNWSPLMYEVTVEEKEQSFPVVTYWTE